MQPATTHSSWILGRKLYNDQPPTYKEHYERCRKVRVLFQGLTLINIRRAALVSHTQLSVRNIDFRAFRVRAKNNNERAQKLYTKPRDNL